MKQRSHPSPLVLSLTTLSLISITIFSLTLNPLGNVAYVIVYLALLFVLFSGVGYCWSLFRRGLVTSKDRSRIFLLSFTLVILIMLRSLQALGGVEALLVIVLAIIIFFYIGRTT